MKEPIKTKIDGKQITFFKNENEDVPIVYANMYAETGRAVLNECEKLGCAPFHLVSITKLRWDEELSPWAHESVVSKSDNFTGEANQYVQCLTEKIIPYIEKKIKKPSFRVIAGYSMGGLFALYAPYVTDVFSKSVSASGSVWYPDFIEYAKEHDFIKNPDKIYMSLGDKEKNSKIKLLTTVEQRTLELYDFYKTKNIDVEFKFNKGNHFTDGELRVAKGIKCILE